VSVLRARERSATHAAGDAATPPAIACVIGNLSLVRAMGRGGIPVAVAGPEPHPEAARSRYCREVVLTPSWVDDPDGAVDAVLAWARRQAAPPVVLYQGDHDLLALSRARDRLGDAVRIVLPRADLVETLVDKLAFAALAEDLRLPIPRTRVLRRDDPVPPPGWDDYPCVLKPASRGHWFDSALVTEMAQEDQKALRIENRSELERSAPLIRDHERDFVLQHEITGGEDNIVSYHAYVRPGGEIVGDFTGRKVRTFPCRYGSSTCVEITDDPSVRQLGREVLERLKFTGVVKVDFKLDDRTGRVLLLELNPRFNLWHHPGAVAGVSIPKLVYTDLTGAAPVAAAGRARAGVRWVNPRPDLLAVREAHPRADGSRIRWLAEVLSAEVNEGFSLRDPLPGLVDLAQTAGRKFRRLRPDHGPVTVGVAE
jgi:predicted ATP-grasp superfamily ATP-dependent carboligase